MPLTYLGDALRQVMVSASALHPLHLDAAVLGGWLIICIAISVRFFRWE
jgi:ABC-2 type transport system permease protein